MGVSSAGGGVEKEGGGVGRPEARSNGGGIVMEHSSLGKEVRVIEDVD